MHVKEKVERFKALYAQAKELVEQEGKIEEAERMMKEADELKEQATRELDILQRAAEGQEFMSGLERTQSPRPETPAPERKTKFDNYDEWSRSMADFLTKQKVDERLQIWNDVGDNALPLFNEQKQMVENVGQSGGFLVPPEQSMEIMQHAGE